MASQDGGDDMHVRVVSRRLVRSSDSMEAHVLALSNLDHVPQPIPVSMFCVYAKPPAANFSAVVAAFEAGLPSLLNHFFPLAGRIAANPRSGLPEAIHCANQGAELVVGEASVALASLDYAASSSFRRFQLPYAEDVALSVQVVSFGCGGFTVAWRTNHVVVDGSALSYLVSSWSELARSGTLPAGARPSHDRWAFRPRAPLSYDAMIDDELTPLDAGSQINVLTTEQSFVRRLYFIEASDMERLRRAASRDGRRATRTQAVSAYLWKALAGVVGAGDTHCRMGWWVNGRRRITAPRLCAAMRNYVGNATTCVVHEADVQEILRLPLSDVAAMVHEAIVAPDYDKRFQDLLDWVEEHKTGRYIETASVGLGSPALIVTAFSSFPIDTDFGFGRAAMALPVSVPAAKLCSGYVETIARPGGDGSWIASAFLWPRLAAALEADEPRVFKPVTAEYLGLFAPGVLRGRL
ncbi:unnamed protein product [Urochloa humidicola]